MNEAMLLAETYQDKCDIYRYEKTEVQGITRQADVLKYNGISCALSRGSLAKPTGQNTTEISTSSKVFFMPDIDVQEGDKLLITQQGAKTAKEYRAGEVFSYYGSHIEVMVKRDERL